MSRRNRTPSIAYLRTSSRANVGADKHSDKRQRQTIEAFAKRAGFEIVPEFYDQAVSGADPIQDRPGFSALLDRIEDNGVRTVIVEIAQPVRPDHGAMELMNDDDVLNYAQIEFLRRNGYPVFRSDAQLDAHARQYGWPAGKRSG